MTRRKANQAKARAAGFKPQKELAVRPDLSAGAVSRPPPRKWLLPAGLLFLLAFLALGRVLNNGFVSYDDRVYVTRNFHVQSGLTWPGIGWAFSATANANWHPLTWLSHLLDFQLFGLHPWGHHLTSLLLHATNTSLVFLVLRSMTGATWRSWFVAALFGLHPLHVESVAWVAERKDVLSTLFWLLALWAYARHARKVTSDKCRVTSDAPFVSRVTRHLSLFYFAALFFFACGLMSKPMVVTLPCVLLLLDYWPLNRFGKNPVWPLVLEKLPFFLLAAGSSVVTFAVQQSGGAVTTTTDLPIFGRVENALVSYVGYLGKLLFPMNLAVIYPYSSHWSLASVIAAGLLLLGVSIFVLALRRRQPWLPTGWWWFVGTLVPVIGLVQVGAQAMADRYTYLPSIGIFMLVSWGACALTQAWRNQTIVLAGAGAVALVLCAALAWRQAGYWQNSGTLFQHARAVTKNNFIACADLGDFEFEQGHSDEAINLYQEAIKLKPGFAPAYEELGVILCKTGRMEEGIAAIQTSLKLEPNSAQAHGDLADALSKEGKSGEAITEYQAAIKLCPDYLDAYNHLGAVLENAGRLDEAIAQFDKVIQSYPAYAEAHNNLGLALEGKGRVDDAMSEYQKALALDPDSSKAHFNLGIILEGKGRLDEAIRQFKDGIKLEPDSPQAHNEFGLLLAQTGRLDEAVGQFQAAVRLKPDYAEAQTNLDVALNLKRGSNR